MANDNEQKFEMKIDPDKGTVTIDLLQWFTTLTPEAREVIYPCWEDLAYEHIRDMTVNRFSGENYDSAIHKLRLDILQSEDAPEMIRNLVSSLLQELDQAKAEKKRWDKAYHDLHRAWREEQRSEMPDYPSYEYQPRRSEVEIDAYIAEHIAPPEVTE
jgi:hypothetical protein